MFLAVTFFRLASNALVLGEEADLEALTCQPGTNMNRSANFNLTTEPPLSGSCC